MNLCKDIIRRSVIGMLIGSLIFLMSLIIGFDQVELNTHYLIVILMMSAVIGIISKVIDLELPFLLRLVIHFILTLMTCVVAYLIYPDGMWSNWMNGGIEFITIYVVVWIGFRTWIYLDMSSINKKIKQRNRK